MSKEAFWQGFAKQAAEEMPAPAAPEKLLKWNPQGGCDPRSPEEMAQSQAVDLVTFPEGVEGASCGNCQFFKSTDPALGAGFCSQPEVKQDVTSRMCCARWNTPGTYRAWEAADPSAVASPEIMGEAGAMQAGEAGLPDPAMVQAEEEQTEDADAKKTPADDEAKDKKPKKSEGKGHTINVNVGSEKKASIAELLDL